MELLHPWKKLREKEVCTKVSINVVFTLHCALLCATELMQCCYRRRWVVAFCCVLTSTIGCAHCLKAFHLCLLVVLSI